MPNTIETGKHLGRVVGAAVFLCASVPAAMADCSKTDIDKHAEYAKVEVKNNSGHTIFYDLYVAKGDDAYGDPIKSVTLQSGQGNKQETEQMHDDTKDNIKVALTAEWQDGPGITKKGILATCEYTVKNKNNGNSSEWDWAADTEGCDIVDLSEFCEDCEISCQKQFTNPTANGNNHWSTTFTISN